MTTTEKRNTRSCKKCKFYENHTRFCKSFVMDILSTATGRYCRNFGPIVDEIPKQYKYRHNSSKYKHNKYKLKNK